MIFFFQWLFQSILGPGLIQLHNHFSQMAGLLGQVIRTTQTQNKRIYTPNIHDLSGIRTHDPSVKASKDSSCLKPHSYCDRPICS
jgi:hypothetical protein